MPLECTSTSLYLQILIKKNYNMFDFLFLKGK